LNHAYTDRTDKNTYCGGGGGGGFVVVVVVVAVKQEAKEG